MTEPTPERIETWFLIPILRDSDRKLHRATLYELLHSELFDIAGGLSGPKSVSIILDPELVPGSWRDPGKRKPTGDESRKYTVLILRERLSALREVLERAANSFDQKEILFVVQGVDQSVQRDLLRGFLKGDPAGG